MMGEPSSVLMAREQVAGAELQQDRLEDADGRTMSWTVVLRRARSTAPA
jgi:hypothetical protein